MVLIQQIETIRSKESSARKEKIMNAKKILLFLSFMFFSLFLLDYWQKDNVYKKYHNRSLIIKEGDISPRLLKSKSFILKMIPDNPELIGLIDNSLKEDKEFYRKILFKAYNAIKYIKDGETLQNRELVVSIVKYGRGATLKFLDESYKKDKEVVLIAVQKNGLSFRYADISLRGDKEVLLKAIESHPLAIKFATPSLKKNKGIVLQTILKDYSYFQHVDDSLRRDKEYILELLSTLPQNEYHSFLQYADLDTLGNDKEFMMKVMKINPYHYFSIDKNLKYDKDILFILKEGLGVENEFYQEMKRLYKFE